MAKKIKEMLRGDEMNGDKVRMDLGGGACRQKYWEELTAEEKVEVLGQHAEYLERENKRLSANLYRVSLVAEQHSHLDGKVMIPVSNRSGDCEQAELPRVRNLLNRQPK